MDVIRSHWWKLLVLSVLLFALVWWALIPWHIYENGLPALAEVVEVWNTGSTVNDEPLAGLRLAVQPLDGDPFQVKKYCRVSFGSEWLFREGAQVEVRYDPRFPGRVALYSAPCDGENASMVLIALGVTTTIFLSFFFMPVLLGRYLKDDLLIKGIPARATVIKVWDTGVTVNDQPRLGLLLEVYPTHGQPYEVETKQVIPYSQLPGLVSGQEIQVRVDRENPRRLRLVTFGKSESPPDAAERLEMLEVLRTRHLISEEEYQQIKQGILETI